MHELSVAFSYNRFTLSFRYQYLPNISCCSYCHFYNVQINVSIFGHDDNNLHLCLIFFSLIYRNRLSRCFLLYSNGCSDLSRGFYILDLFLIFPFQQFTLQIYGRQRCNYSPCTCYILLWAQVIKTITQRTKQFTHTTDV